jgi:VWFA-related protein
MRVACWSISLACLLISPAVGRAQSAASPNAPTSQETTVIRSTTRLVQVSVVVRDKSGNPVTNLKQEDFAIFDEGLPQHIAFFGSEAPSSPAPVTPGHLPLNFFTNRFDLKGQDPGAVTIVLFDALNTAFEDQAWVRGQVIRFLQHVDRQDHVALYGLNTQLIVLQDFTQDSSALLNAVKRFTPKELAAFDASHPGDLDVQALHNDPAWMKFQARVNEASQMISDQYKVNRVNATIAAIEAIANHVAGIPGRKNLVWVSGGFPMEIGLGMIAPDRDARLLNPNDAAKALSSVSMAIYPIDAHGIENPGMGPSMQSPGKANESFFARQSNRDSFRLLADATGGKAFYGSNDVAGAVQRAFDDGRYAYTLGFYPDHGQWNGKYRKIKVTLTTAGAHLRYRKGYFSYPDRPADENKIKAELQDVATSPLEATNLAMLISVKSEGPLEKRNLDLRVEMDPKQFLLTQDGTRETGALDMYYLQRDARGNILSADKHRLGLNFDPRQYESLAKTGIIFESHLTMQPQTSEIRVVVRDAGSGAMGSVTLPAASFELLPANPK